VAEVAAAATFDFTRRLRLVSDRDVDRLREHFLAPAEAFDAESLGDRLLFPLEMSWFYGEPIWHELSEAQRLMLNRLTFCQSYFSTAVAEAATNTLNFQAALQTLIREDPEVALYMAREVVEETTHIQSFLIVIRKVLAHYGLDLDALRRANVSLSLSERYVQAHSLAGWLRGNLDFYYFTRFPLNVNQKTVERCTIDESDMHDGVRAILKAHAIDEARHMQMSRATGKVALARMGVLRTPGCIAFAHFAARIYIGRHAKDGALQRGTRTNTLALVGVPAARAAQAYAEWRDRKNQPEDPPLVRAGRRYYVRQMFEYVDELDVSPRLRAYMKRVIGAGYADVAGDFAGRGESALDFPELTRS
jgi:hypothetical protein